MTVRTHPTTWACATCQATFRHRPVLHLGLAFCCAGCAADGPCTCSYDEEEIDDAPEARHDPALAHHAAGVVGAAR